MNAVVETEIFLRYASAIWTDLERMEFVSWIAANPDSGTSRGHTSRGQVLHSNISRYNRPMARPLRIELSGGLYHVTSRGDRREAIYFSDADRIAWSGILGQVCARFNWVCHAYCQMSNHYHLVIETPEGNLECVDICI